ncbi:peptidylprolyl isomerase [Akkermansia sp. N21169]|uniref:peptidylprolyl isomerase n=1 Tax=Akkermansia sp. N21169 TaxID=3040765 RepID=UPI00244EA267|nr:peptidylprolyl isomerase [Akkermansia sp. N21169]MDH3069493.1 peptidylprolyl isomerase [Akkermansia sp. N21169]
MKKFIAIMTALAALMICLSFASTEGNGTDTQELKDVRVILNTTQGQIHLVVYASKTPVTAANFLNLAKRGYYNGVTFHRVIPNFMIQTGDPSGTGYGTPNYSFENEIVEGLTHNGPGILSMANTGQPNSNGSQFFITHRATPHLDGKHTVFGRVLAGQDVVNAIRKGDKIKSVTIVDSPEPVLKKEAERVRAWNKALDSPVQQKP